MFQRQGVYYVGAYDVCLLPVRLHRLGVGFLFGFDHTAQTLGTAGRARILNLSIVLYAQNSILTETYKLFL